MVRQGEIILLISQIKKLGLIIFKLSWLVNHLVEYTPGTQFQLYYKLCNYERKQVEFIVNLIGMERNTVAHSG